MKPKYRIVKVEDNRFDSEHVCYKIKKRFLWWWRDLRVNFFDSVIEEETDKRYMVFENRNACFLNSEQAEKILENIINPFVVEFKNHEIRKVYKINFGGGKKGYFFSEVYYISSPSKSIETMWNKWVAGCEYSDDLNSIKEKIKKKSFIRQKKETIIKEY
jgi:hypothetical protein